MTKTATIFIKPMTWASKTEFYLGLEPSDPSAHHCSRLGAWFLKVRTIDSARAIANAEVRRYALLGRDMNVVECPHYVGY